LIAGLRQSSEPGSAGGHLRVHRPSGQPAYAVMLTPAAPSIAGRGKEAPAVLVFVSDPGGRFVSDLKVLTELFGFPPAEGRLVIALLSGMSAPDFARKAGVTHNTVRTLLARAMARTDSRSQLEMVLLVPARSE
jgi:DNA-binding CsgD family transcriptional regulator